MAMKLKRQRLVSDGTMARMMQTAADLWKRCDFEQCAEIMERASRLDPANSSILLDLGAVHGKAYDYAAAERCFERAIRVAPNKTEALRIAGLRCLNFDQHEMAERFFQRTIEQKDAPPEVLLQIAEIYERQHRSEDAAQYVERALRLDSNSGAAMLVRARLERQRGCLGDAEQLLLSIPSTAGRDVLVGKYYEMGGILDRQKRYDEAMTAFLEAKLLMQGDAAPHIAELRVIRNRLRLLKDSVTAEMLERWFDFGRELQPHYRMGLLGGNPRSGTTLLEQVLDSHPDIISAEETEIFHNNAYMPLVRSLPDNAPLISVLESASKPALQQSREAYFRSMGLFQGNPVSSRLLIDKNPSLTYLIPALARIFPEIKLIIALRDPRDVCLSCFMQSFSAGQVSSAYLTLGGTVEEYTALMSTWMTIKPLIKNPYLEVKYEDMVDNLEGVARRTLDFLEVPWDAGVLHFDEHARKKLVRSPTYADVTKPVFKTAVGRWRNYEKYLQPHLEKLAPFVKALGYDE
jgi:tetratricopeptide (TPR) repeat protein